MSDTLFRYDKDLTSLTTFGVKASCSVFAEYKNVRELTWISRQKEYLDNQVLHIGGGSNLLFTGHYDGLVLRSAIMGKNIYRNHDTGAVTLIVGAGEDWPELVRWSVAEGLAGLENLAGIPGQAGASAVQNIGAYGVEAKDVIFSVECFDCEKREVVTFFNRDCNFGYRDSRFKHEWKGRYYVLRVALRLTESDTAAHLEYGPLKDMAERLGHAPSPSEVAREIESIRDAKLPDPKVTGSAGSFFKNPVIRKNYFEEEVLSRNPEVPFYPVNDHYVKVPAGWLIEHAGLKGERIGGAEVYPRQCLVIANTGNATAQDVIALAHRVTETVEARFGIHLSREVNYISSDIEVTILGSGTSKGIPEIACDCHVCRSEDPRDKRDRASALVQAGGTTILIDASPDLRLQAVRAHLHHIDALIITHEHYDHVGGIDDLRPFCEHGDLRIFARPDVCEALKRRLDYAFAEHPYPGVPSLKLIPIENRPFYIDGVKIIPIESTHGNKQIYGYRIGDFAYMTDVKTIEERELDKLTGVKTLVLNALRERPHFSHLNFREALELIEKIEPQTTYLTHFSHEAGTHVEIQNRLPSNIHPAYDGLRFIVK